MDCVLLRSCHLARLRQLLRYGEIAKVAVPVERTCHTKEGNELSPFHRAPHAKRANKDLDIAGLRSSSAGAPLGRELRYQGPRQNDPARPKGTEALTSSPCLQAGQSYLIVTRTVSGPREATLTRQQPVLSSPVSGRSARRDRVRVLESRGVRREPRFDAQQSVLQHDARSATLRTRRAYPGAA